MKQREKLNGGEKMRIYIRTVKNDEELGTKVDKKNQEVWVRVGKDFAEKLHKGEEVDFILAIKIR